MIMVLVLTTITIQVTSLFVASCIEEYLNPVLNVRIQLWSFFIAQFGNFCVMVFFVYTVWQCINLGEASLLPYKPASQVKTEDVKPQLERRKFLQDLLNHTEAMERKMQK